MKDLITYIVKTIVDNPDAVTVEETSPETGFINIEVTVAQEDLGKVIGKEGKTIKAIRNLARVMAVKLNCRFNLTLHE